MSTTMTAGETRHVTPPPPTEVEPAAVGLGARPARTDQVVDLVGLGVLGLVALSACGPAFGGAGYLVVGGVGLAIGLLLGLVAAGRLSLLVLTLVTLAIYFVVGGPLAVPDRTTAVVVPSVESVSALADGAFRGAYNVLTTIVPLGDGTSLLSVPWMFGLLCGVVSMSVARRSKRLYLLALLVPLVVLVAGIVLGVDAEAWTRQGAVFAAVAVLWGSLRQRSARTGPMGTSPWRRLPAAVVVVVAAAILGSAIASTSFVAGPRARTVVRDQVEPPVDLRRLPSPLEGFRNFRSDESRDAVMFEVGGAEEGDLLRLATLDSYDGVVWHVTTSDTSKDSSGFFQRVGDRIPVEVDGDQRQLKVEVVEYEGPWLLNLGSTARVDFGADSAALQDDLRHNVATGTSAVPSGMGEGVEYELEAVIPADSSEVDEGEADRGVSGATLRSIEVVEEQGARLLDDVPGDEVSALAKARALEKVLSGQVDDAPRRGYFSNGQQGEPNSLAGHNAERMSTMMDPAKGEIVGNEEQFASGMALLASAQGLPARVVMGFRAPAPGSDGRVTLTGDDVSAWAEVAVDGEGWVVLDATPRDDVPPKNKDPKIIPEPERVLPTPTTTTTMPGSSASGAGASCEPNCPGAPGWQLPGWVVTAAKIVLPPLFIIGALTAAIAGLKRARRKRRRTNGTPADQINAGWSEVCDLARDLGDVVPPVATRRETAVLLGRPGVSNLARRADSLIFGPAAIDDAVAESYWGEVELTRQAMVGPLSPFDRWKALVNPSSLRLARRHRSRMSRPALPDPRRLLDTALRRT